MKKLVLIISCFHEPNVTAVIKKLAERNVAWFRFNTETYPLINQISLYCSDQSKFHAIVSDGDNTVDTREVTSIWYRRFGDFLLNDGISGYEERFVRSECLALVQSVFTQMDCFSVNARSNENQANTKVYQLQIAKEVGLSVPQTLITNRPDDVRSFFKSNSGNVLFKPVSGAALGGGPPRYSKEIQESYPGRFAIPPAAPVDDPDTANYAVFAKILTPDHLDDIGRVVGCPVAFQEYIEKRLELRITVVGEAIFAAEIYSQEYEATKIDWRHLATVPDSMPTHKVHDLPDEISSKLLALMNRLGLVFGCIDMILTPEGEYVFLEINPSGQWGWVETLTGMPITDALTDMLIRGSVGVGS